MGADVFLSATRSVFEAALNGSRVLPDWCYSLRSAQLLLGQPPAHPRSLQEQVRRSPACRSSRDRHRHQQKHSDAGRLKVRLSKACTEGLLFSTLVWQVIRKHPIWSANAVATNPGILLNALHDTSLTGLSPFTLHWARREGGTCSKIAKWQEVPTSFSWGRPIKQNPSQKHGLGQIPLIPPSAYGGGEEIKAERGLSVSKKQFSSLYFKDPLDQLLILQASNSCYLLKHQRLIIPWYVFAKGGIPASAFLFSAFHFQVFLLTNVLKNVHEADAFSQPALLRRPAVSLMGGKTSKPRVHKTKQDIQWDLTPGVCSVQTVFNFFGNKDLLLGF